MGVEYAIWENSLKYTPRLLTVKADQELEVLQIVEWLFPLSG